MEMLQQFKECFVCGDPHVECHHVFHGPYRKAADRYGMTVWLCPRHHRGTDGVHGRDGHELDLRLKRHAQAYFEANLGNRDTFRDLFGKSYL